MSKENGKAISGWRAAPTRLLLLAGGSFGLAALGAVKLTDDVVEAQTLPWDRALMLGVHQHWLTPGLVETMRLFTWVGTTPFVALLGMALLIYLHRRGDRSGQAATLIGLGGGAGLILGLKHWVQRPRPELFTHLVTADGYSFPSGHSLAAVVTYGLLVLFALQQMKGRWARLLVGVGGAMLVAAIGFSRIYLGVHYPSDVLAGYLFGAAWFCLIATGYLWFRRFRARGGPSRDEA